MQRFAVTVALTGLAWFMISTCAFGSAVEVSENNGKVTLSNDAVSLTFDLKSGTYCVSSAPDGTRCLSDARPTADLWGTKERKGAKWLYQWSTEEMSDALGKGMRLLISMECKSRQLPVYRFSYTLYENRSCITMGFGVKNIMSFAVRIMNASPLADGTFFPGSALDKPMILNGAAGAAEASVSPALERSCPNNLLLTARVNGMRRSIVWGGLANKEFAKYVKIKDGAIGMSADDPVGRLVDAGCSYSSEDTFYLDVTASDPFTALETYGLTLRTANHANPNLYDFPTVCGWALGALSGGPNVNNSKALIEEMEFAQKSGFTKYSKVGIRLEPDTYCYKDGNTEQGWWDDGHWAKFGHLVAPYETFAKWCAALKERGGVPFTYFQVGLPSDDYAQKFPGHMLFNDISRMQVKHRHHEPLVTFDYTDPGFQKHMGKVWDRLRKAGMIGIKFDYPETGWRAEGGFENKYATTAFAYREIFRLCRDGLGPEARIHERNLGTTGRPCLDLTIGLIDLQRTWRDSNEFVPEMVTGCGLRWYKNRVVVGYYPDSKALHLYSREERRTLLTMIYLVSGRLELATSFRQFTPDMVHDMSRVFPLYSEPRSARPLDAFTGVKNPRVYDLELTPDWHQVALFNPSSNRIESVSAPLSGLRVDGAVGLDAGSAYYVYDFWEDALVGKMQGTAIIEKKLGPLGCAMLSVRKAQETPQVLSTSRHILQGWVDLADVKWDASIKNLSGIAKVIGGEPFRIVLAGNGLKAGNVSAKGTQARLEAHPAAQGLTVLVLEQSESGNVAWQVTFN